MVIVLDTSLSLNGSRIGSLYAGTLEIMEFLEDYCERSGRFVNGDILLMGTGDDGDGCEWLCGEMVPVDSLHNQIQGEFVVNGHTVLIQSLLAVEQCICDNNLNTDEVMMILITDGEFGFTTKDDVENALAGRLGGCERLVMLVGHAYDEDIVFSVASSREMVFKNNNYQGIFNVMIDAMNRRRRS